MQRSTLAVLVAAALFVVWMAGAAQAGAPPNDYVVRAGSLSGDLGDVNVEDGDPCAEALSALLEAKGKIKHVQSGSGSDVVYTLEGKGKSVAVIVCGIDL